MMPPGLDADGGGALLDPLPDLFVAVPELEPGLPEFDELELDSIPAPTT